MKKVQEMTKEEFERNCKNAEDGDMVAANVMIRYSCEMGGFTYCANIGDCDAGDTLLYWYEDVMDDDNYVDVIGARI